MKPNLKFSAMQSNEGEGCVRYLAVNHKPLLNA